MPLDRINDAFELMQSGKSIPTFKDKVYLECLVEYRIDDLHLTTDNAENFSRSMMSSRR